MTLPDVDSLSSYGGALNNLEPIVDPTTDRDASLANKAYANVAMMSHLTPRAWAKITTAASTGAMVLVAHDACWGNLAGVAPTLARTGVGVYTITWAASQSDELNVAHTINLRFAFGEPVGNTVFMARPQVTAANVVTLYVFDGSNAASDTATTVNVLVF